ncbi:MAG: SRPBCC domain-containing protein [Chloroflexota bacterium]
MPIRIITFERLIQADPQQVTAAFTNAAALREWLCDVATVDPRPGGRMYLAWNSGYYAGGEYTSVQPGRQVEFVWFGRDDPNRSEVIVTCRPEAQGTRLELEHALPEESQDWARVAAEIEKGWGESLENLASVLETGIDLRLARRPMLGITLNDFTPEHAAAQDVPVTQGVRIDDLVPGMGAEAAGLQRDDVIVAMDGRPVANFNDIAGLLANKRAGERLPVEVYRGPQRLSLEMELSARPLPEVPWSLKELAAQMRTAQGQAAAEIQAFLSGVSDAQASYKPAANEWSVKDVLAHLLNSERGYQQYVADLVCGQERWADDYAGNLDAQVKATVATYASLAALLEALLTAFQETAHLFAFLPHTLLERKGAYWRLAAGAQENPRHFQSHLQQMRIALEAAQAAG